MNEPKCNYCHEPIPHNIVVSDNGCHPACAEKRNNAAVLQERTLLAIEALPDDRQRRIYTACVKLREFICEFGPDIRYALSLTGAEIASGTIDIQPVDAGPQIIVPNALIVKPH